MVINEWSSFLSCDAWHLIPISLSLSHQRTSRVSENPLSLSLSLSLSLKRRHTEEREAKREKVWLYSLFVSLKESYSFSSQKQVEAIPMEKSDQCRFFNLSLSLLWNHLFIYFWNIFFIYIYSDPLSISTFSVPLSLSLSLSLCIFPRKILFWKLREKEIFLSLKFVFVWKIWK